MIQLSVALFRATLEEDAKRFPKFCLQKCNVTRRLLMYLLVLNGDFNEDFERSRGTFWVQLLHRTG